MTDRVDSQDAIKVFISYSRQDMAFTDKLDAALKEREVSPLIDRSEIHAFEDWWQRIQGLIAKADTVIFVLSPDAVASNICRKEVAYAASLNKRFAPIVFRRIEDGQVPHELARLNYIFFDDDARFHESVSKLTEALQTDIVWVRRHTDTGQSARAWSTANRPSGLLLRSPLLEEAERWIASRPPLAPEPTAEMQAFVLESRRDANRRRNILTMVLAGGLVVAIGLAGFAYWQRDIAKQNELAAVKSEARAIANERVANDQRELADERRKEALQTAATSDFQRGSTLLLKAESSSEGIALLARAVRTAGDARAVTRLWSLFQQRQFWFPQAEGNSATRSHNEPPQRKEISDRISQLAFTGLSDSSRTKLTFSGNGQRAFTSVSGDMPRYRIWRSDGTPITDWITAPSFGKDSPVTDLSGVLSETGDFLALTLDYLREPSTIRIVSLRTNKQIGDNIVADGLWPTTQGAGFNKVAFLGGGSSSKDKGTLLLAASSKGDASVFIIDDQSVTRTAYDRHAAPIAFSDVDESKQWLMTAAQDGSVGIVRLDDGSRVGNILTINGRVGSIVRTSQTAIAVVHDDQQIEHFELKGPWAFPLIDGVTPRQRGRVCKAWQPVGMDELDGGNQTNLETPLGTISIRNKRQVIVSRDSREIVRSPIFASEIALTCITAAGSVSITTSTFTTEVWAADFSRRIGTSVSERPTFTLDNTPETTNMTVVSEPRDTLLIRSFIPDPPDYGLMWYSAWDLKTAAPLIDRMKTFDPLVEFVAISFRLSESGRYLVFAKGLYETDGQPVSWIELDPPRDVLSWLPNFAEALVNSHLSNDGISEPVEGRASIIAEGVERLKKLSAK